MSLKNKRFDEELTLKCGGKIIRNNGDVNLSCFNHGKLLYNRFG